jgi:hypothetical protein
MKEIPTPTPDTRIGFHYFPDTLHYRENDLRAWLPELRALGASWLVLVAPPDRAIPEPFLRGVMDAGIEPVLHFSLPLQAAPAPEEMRLLFDTYAHWGVRYAVLFDRPNRRRAWSARDWAQNELVERFIDIYLPLAEGSLSAGLVPVFPPLEPGGDYWDTAFLRTALRSIQRRGHQALLSKMVLGAYSQADNRPLGWGGGGPECWPGARPYYTPVGEEDQRGFRIFDWYLPIAQAVLGTTPRLLLLGMGSHVGDRSDPQRPPVDEARHAERNLAIARLLLDDETVAGDLGVLAQESVPSPVLAGFFWLLAAAPDSPFRHQAWFQPDGATLPAAGALRHWLAQRLEEESEEDSAPVSGAEPARPIANYLLLPTYEWGVADWHLEVIRPFVKKHKPTVGFSLAEAAWANRVTVIGGPADFPEEQLEQLRAAGCMVERIGGDGTSIASQLEAA